MPRMNTSRYRDLNTALREQFGCRVQKITLDAALTCPNRDGTLGVGGCIYCNARGSGTGLSQQYNIPQQLERGKERLRRRYKAKKFIAYFQSFSNTYGPLDELKQLYLEALAIEDVVGLAIGTRPDCVADDVLDMLADLNRRTYLWDCRNPCKELQHRGPTKIVDYAKRAPWPGPRSWLCGCGRALPPSSILRTRRMKPL